MDKSFKNISVKGFRAAGISAGIKKNSKPDLALIISDVPAIVAGVFTRNSVKAAPVVIDVERVKKRLSRGIIVNSGNANACTGMVGIRDASRIIKAVENAVGVNSGDILISSTGVIGERLPVEKIISRIPNLVSSLSPVGWQRAADAIMTTDAFPKVVFKKVKLSNARISILGIAKGAGMICPDMATMLAFFATDALISPGALKKSLKTAVDASFNKITVDGDMSTNDTVLIFANGLSGGKRIKQGSSQRDFKTFTSALASLSLTLAKEIVRDGEGATKVIEVNIRGAEDERSAELLAGKAAGSLLVKTAFFGGDPNWGRIMAALGSAEIAFNPSNVDISLNRIKVVRNGVSTGLERAAKKAIIKGGSEVSIEVNLKMGKAFYTLWTSDIGYDYVRINSAYSRADGEPIR